MHTKIWLLPIVLLFLSCDQKLPIDDFYSLFPSTESAVYKPFSVNEDALIKPKSLVIHEGKIFLLNYGVADAVVSVFDLATGSHIENILKIGQGPNEFLDPTILHSSNGRLFVSDRGRRGIMDVSDYREDRYTFTGIHQDSVLIAPFKSYPKAGGLWLTTGIITTNKQIALLDSAGKCYRTILDYPQQPNHEADFIENSFAFQGSVAFNDNETKMVITYSEGVLLAFYDINDINNPQTLHEYYYVFPEYSYDGDYSVAFSKENTTGIIKVYGSKDYCFCLFSDKRYIDFTDKKEEYYKGDKILVFDWEGTPVKIIDLGERYYSFAVDEANKELVLLGTDQETYDYKLSKVSY